MREFPATGLTLLGLSSLDVKGPALETITTVVLAGALLLTAGSLIFRQTLVAVYAARVGELGPGSTAILTIIAASMSARDFTVLFR